MIRGRGATEVLLTRERIDESVRALAEEISHDYRDRRPLLVGLLKGSVIFLADLVRHLTIEVEIDFISISSYKNRSTSSGSVRLLRDLDRDIFDRDVLVVEDIVDSGLSLSYIRSMLLARKPRSLAIAALLDKRERRVCNVDVRYIGIPIEDRFVVGYGLDYKERYRGLPEISVLSPDEILDEEPA